MPKFSSLIKALIPEQKSVVIPQNFRNFLPISPKDQNDLSGLIMPMVGANNWNHQVDIEYLQKMYDCHDLVYNCIDLVSTTFGLAKLRVKQVVDGKTKYIPDHPLQQLLESTPNSSMTGYDLKQSYIVHRLLYGTEAFILLRGHMFRSEDEANQCPECIADTKEECPHILWSFNKGPVTQIIPIHMDRLGKKVFDTPKGKKEYFMYSPTAGMATMPVHPNNIMTDPRYNPAVSFYGSSPTGKVRRWLEIDLGLSKQIGAYFANNAIPSMAVMLRPRDVPYDQDPSEILEMIRDKWMNRFSMNGDGTNQGTSVKSPAFLYGDIDIKQVQDTLKDIVVKPLFYEIQNRICMAYKVPPSFFEFGQDYGAQSTTIQQQEKNFYNRAIAPELESFKAKLERYVVPSYEDPTLQLEWDLSNVGIAAFLEKEKHQSVTEDWLNGLIARDHARGLLGYNPIGNELGDDLYRETIISDGRNGNPMLGGGGLSNQFKPKPSDNEE